MAEQPINTLPKKTTVADTDTLLVIGASEEYQIDYGKLADALLDKLTSKKFTLDQGIKTLIAALNELNSKTKVQAYALNSVAVKNSNTYEFVKAFDCVKNNVYIFFLHPYWSVGRPVGFKVTYFINNYEDKEYTLLEITQEQMNGIEIVPFFNRENCTIKVYQKTISSNQGEVHTMEYAVLGFK